MIQEKKVRRYWQEWISAEFIEGIKKESEIEFVMGALYQQNPTTADR
jgi:hypothetical protein